MRLRKPFSDGCIQENELGSVGEKCANWKNWQDTLVRNAIVLKARFKHILMNFSDLNEAPRMHGSSSSEAADRSRTSDDASCYVGLLRAPTPTL
jgi:hypothetical protein